MKTMDKTRTVLVAAMLALSACANKEIKPHNWALDVQNAETREAHELLADHYEEIAKAMDADADEERAMLAQYQAHPHRYGKRILDLKAHAEAMIMDFEKAARESREMASYHRSFAVESAK